MSLCHPALTASDVTFDDEDGTVKVLDFGSPCKASKELYRPLAPELRDRVSFTGLDVIKSEPKTNQYLQTFTRLAA